MDSRFHTETVMDGFKLKMDRLSENLSRRFPFYFKALGQVGQVGQVFWTYSPTCARKAHKGNPVLTCPTCPVTRPTAPPVAA